MTTDATTMSEVDTVLDAVKFRNQKRRIIWMLFAYSAILGCVSCFIPEENKLLDFLTSLPFMILGVSWCFIDARQFNVRIGRVTRLLLVLILAAGLPLYLIQTRGRHAPRAVFFAITIACAAITCIGLAEHATLSIGDAMGYWVFVPSE